MAGLATIVLTPIVDGSPSRNFTLDANNNVMSIGRASKRDQKGRTPAGDNGWFDSRVMSRDHAEIIFQETNKTIQVEDLGSTHGTWLNNMRLHVHQPAHIFNGDILRFGIDVERNDGEIFSALSMRVKMDFQARPAPNKASVEDSDLEVIEVAAPVGTHTAKSEAHQEGSTPKLPPCPTEIASIINKDANEAEFSTDPIDLTEPDIVEREAPNTVESGSDNSESSEDDEKDLESGLESEIEEDDEMPYYSSDADSLDDGSESEACDDACDETCDYLIDASSMCDDSEQDCIDPALLMAANTNNTVCASTSSFVPTGFTGFTGFTGGLNIPPFPAKDQTCATTAVLDCPMLPHPASKNRLPSLSSKSPASQAQQSSTDANPLKRKFPDIEAYESLILTEGTKSADESKVAPPAKRVKSSQSSSSLVAYSTTAVVSALLGGLGTIVVLASLPPDYFQ